MLLWAVCLLLAGLAEGVLLPLPAEILVVPAGILRPFRWEVFAAQTLCGALGGLAIAHFCGQWHEAAFVRALTRLPGQPAAFVARARERARGAFVPVVLAVATFRLPARLVAFEAGVEGRSLPVALARASLGLAVRYVLAAFLASRLRLHAMSDLFRVSRNAALAAAILVVLTLAAIAWIEMRHRRPPEAT